MRRFAAKGAGGVFAELRFNSLLGAGNNRNDAVRIGRRDIGKIARKIGGEGARVSSFGMIPITSEFLYFDAHFAIFVGEEN